MNGFLENQTSGNDWHVPIPMMLHERIQNFEGQPRTRQSDASFLEEIELQMQRFENDYRRAIAEVRKIYVLPADSSVIDFLSDHRVLPQLLIDAAPRLKMFFRDTVFALRASSDEYGWQTLYADAMWAGDAREAIHSLDQFEDEWWIPNCRPARGALTFTYRLI